MQPVPLAGTLGFAGSDRRGARRQVCRQRRHSARSRGRWHFQIHSSQKYWKYRRCHKIASSRTEGLVTHVTQRQAAAERRWSPPAALTLCRLLFGGLPRPLGLEELQDRGGPARTMAGLHCRAAEACGRVWIRWNQLIHMNPNLKPE